MTAASSEQSACEELDLHSGKALLGQSSQQRVVKLDSMVLDAASRNAGLMNDRGFWRSGLKDGEMFAFLWQFSNSLRRLNKSCLN
jgi:hypothetical protein